MADMLSGLGSMGTFDLNIPGLSDIQLNGSTALEQPMAGSTDFGGQTDTPAADGSNGQKKPGFNHFDAGMNAIKGASVDLVSKGLELLQQKPLESIATVGAVGALAAFGGAPAIFLMGALGFAGSNFMAVQKFNEAGRLAADAKAAANDFRFEEAQSLHTQSQAVWSGVGTGVGLSALGGLLAHRGLSVNAAAKGIQLAKGFGGKVGEFFGGLLKKGYWAAAPEAGNAVSATAAVLQRKAGPKVGQLLGQARSVSQQAGQQAQHLAQQASQQVKEQTPKATGLFGKLGEQFSGAVDAAKQKLFHGAAQAAETGEEIQKTAKSGGSKMIDLMQ